MKNIFFNVIMVVAVLLLQCCHTHDHDHDGAHGHDHGEEHGQEEEIPGQIQKTVTLNQSQYFHADIDTGWFEMKNINDVVHANGFTELSPQNKGEVTSLVSGIINTIKVIEGDHVRKGQLLASMTSTEFNNMLLESVRLKESKQLAEAQIAYLELEHDRQQKLSTENVNARKIFEKVAAELKMERIKLKALSEQQVLLDQSIRTIGQPGASHLSIVAPITGYINKVNVNIGSSVTTGMPLFAIVDNSKMHVDLKVYEKDLDKIKVDQKVRFIFSNQSNKEISGKIYNIGKSFGNESKAVTVHADIENFDGKLIPGMYVNALIDIGSSKVQTLPEEAVVMAEGRHFIFLLKKDKGKDHDHTGHAHNHGKEHDHPHKETGLEFLRLEVKVGNSKLGHIEVTPLGILMEGDKIVTKGAYYLQSHLQKSEGGGGHHHH